MVLGAGLLAPGAVQASSALLRVEGLVEHPLTLGLDELRAFPRRVLVDKRPRNGSASESQVAGVLLRDVLDKARPVERKPKDLRKTVVIARARDGYVALFTWVELFLFSTGEGVLVVVERDGAALPASEGPLALVSLRDERPGPRHVKWLESIELRLVDG